MAKFCKSYLESSNYIISSSSELWILVGSLSCWEDIVSAICMLKTVSCPNINALWNILIQMDGFSKTGKRTGQAQMEPGNYYFHVVFQ